MFIPCIKPPVRKWHRWTEKDVLLLKYVYPAGGVRAVQDVFCENDRPHRSSADIRTMAHKLGVRYEGKAVQG